jgi:hypothetical protein
VLWMLGGRIKLEFPVAAVSVGDELGSKAEGAWGATPINVCSVLPSTHPWR